ncbi:MAG: hypothetical protein EG822_14485 [Deltaproteobacteria bacterium]|nr:hypothetical protein [Deltaproteobacteria bacterium]TLN02179.1 MAG: hypothetical protein FDZ73_12965 [bacterium]
MAEYSSQSVFQPSIPKHLLTEGDLDFLSAFRIDSEPDGDDKLYLFAEDWCTTANIEDEAGTERKLDEYDLFFRFQEIIRRSNGALPWISKETTYTCSKMLRDGFGGSAVFITADAVQFIGTSSWLEQRISEAETGDIGPHTEDPPAEAAISTQLLLKHLIESFPQADPASGYYNEPISGCEAVDFLSGFIPEVRKCIDAEPPRIAVVLDGGLVRSIVSDCPERLSPKEIVVIDYDTDGDEEGIIQVPQGEDRLPEEAYANVIEITKAEIDIAAVISQL